MPSRWWWFLYQLIFGRIVINYIYYDIATWEVYFKIAFRQLSNSEQMTVPLLIISNSCWAKKFFNFPVSSSCHHPLSCFQLRRKGGPLTDPGPPWLTWNPTLLKPPPANFWFLPVGGQTPKGDSELPEGLGTALQFHLLPSEAQPQNQKPPTCLCAPSC